MKSPFPGMDPYLEKHWGDVHHRLIQYACDSMQPNLPDDLRASVEERVFLESEPELSRTIVPDLHIAQARQLRTEQATSSKGTGLALPLGVEVNNEPVTEGYIEIHQPDG